MKNIILVLAALMLLPGYVLAGNQYKGGHNQNHFQRKGANFETGYGNIIIGFPVTDLGLKYYYAVRDEDTYHDKAQGLTEDDIEDIAERTAEKTVKGLLEALKKVPSDPGAEPPVKPDTLDGKVAKIFEARCNNCHAVETKQSGGIALLNYGKLEESTREQRWDIWDQVDQQLMPQGGDPLAIDEIDTIKEWARAKK